MLGGMAESTTKAWYELSVRLSLVAPAGWPTTVVGGQRVLVAPGFAGATPDLVVSWGDLIALPDDLRAWEARILGAEVPPGSSLRVLEAADRKTAKGWPMRVIDARVVSADGLPIELRLAAFYGFFEWGAAALVRSTNPARFTEHAPRLLELLAAGEPDWSSEVVALEQLWVGVT
jgi:hypothetical protein